MCNGYIESVGTVMVGDFKLTLWDRFMIGLTFWDACMIGKFTRENVNLWLMKRVSPDTGMSPVDFHAVWGNTDIPWATKEGRDYYNKYYND